MTSLPGAFIFEKTKTKQKGHVLQADLLFDTRKSVKSLFVANQPWRLRHFEMIVVPIGPLTFERGPPVHFVYHFQGNRMTMRLN